MADADAPYAPVSELGSLRLDWPKAIFSYMGRHQVDLEHFRHECRERFSNVQSGFIWTWLSFSGARCPGALYGGARHRIVLTICAGLIPYRLRLRQPIWHDGSLLGRFPGSDGSPSYVHPSLGWPQILCCLAGLECR